MPTRDIFNAKTQSVEPAEMSVDANNEIVATFADGSFLKFPSKIVETKEVGPDADAETTVAPVTPAHLDSFVEAHQASNEGQVVITPEYEAAVAAERAAALVAAGLPAETPVEAEPTNGNTMPEGDKTNAPSPDQATS